MKTRNDSTKVTPCLLLICWRASHWTGKQQELLLDNDDDQSQPMRDRWHLKTCDLTCLFAKTSSTASLSSSSASILLSSSLASFTRSLSLLSTTKMSPADDKHASLICFTGLAHLSASWDTAQRSGSNTFPSLALQKLWLIINSVQIAAAAY